MLLKIALLIISRIVLTRLRCRSWRDRPGSLYTTSSRSPKALKSTQSMSTAAPYSCACWGGSTMMSSIRYQNRMHLASFELHYRVNVSLPELRESLFLVPASKVGYALYASGSIFPVLVKSRTGLFAKQSQTVECGMREIGEK